MLSSEKIVTQEVLFTAFVASTDEEILGCQKLRYRVFADEMGANIKTERDGVDEDFFDQYCKHLYVRNYETGEIIATTRVLTSNQAKIAGEYYSQSEFKLDNITALEGSFLEIGRTCVRNEYRTGAAINALWQCVASVLAESEAKYLFGCYSIPLANSEEYIAALMEVVKEKYYAPKKYRVKPVIPFKTYELNEKLNVVLPSLLKRYLNMGAYISGEPCFDKDFNTADFFIFLDKSKMSKRYARRFLNQKNTNV